MWPRARFRPSITSRHLWTFFSCCDPLKGQSRKIGYRPGAVPRFWDNPLDVRMTGLLGLRSQALFVGDLSLLLLGLFLSGFKQRTWIFKDRLLTWHIWIRSEVRRVGSDFRNWLSWNVYHQTSRIDWLGEGWLPLMNIYLVCCVSETFKGVFVCCLFVSKSF